ncbi:porin [Vibrio sp. RE88]|uniref:porin n=1 Tax=Vibrio sp. RE88 TaxID=2607610 RepID=UPI0014937DA4|nr:porin [Vibrio sp. RE88]NOH62975.1 porin [Vibrio sp. RE88]
MKKTLVALSVLAAAANVNAAEIYGSDTSSVSLKGEIDIYLTESEKDTSATATEKKEADISTWAKIQVDAEHKVNDKYTVFGSFEVETKNTTGVDNNAVFDDVLAGFKTDTWGMAFGEVGDLADSMDAIQKDDITNEGNYMGSTGGHHKESSGHGAVFKGQFVEGLTLVADVMTDSTENVDNTYGVSLDYSIDNFTVGASLVTGDAALDVDYRVAGISASAEFGGLFLAATYAKYEGNQGYGYWDLKDLSQTASTYANGDTIGVAAAYTIDKVRLYTTYATYTTDELQTANTVTSIADLDGNNLVLGVDYAFMENVLLFAEYQTAEQDVTTASKYEADGVTAGVYYTF